MRPIVLFDLDGTLTDPEIGIVGSFRHALDAVGHPIDPAADLRWIIGPPIRDNLGRIGLPDDRHDEAIAIYRARHLEIGLYEADLIPGMAELVSALSADGRRLGLATAKPLLQATRTLDHFGLTSHFEVVAGARLDGVASTKAHIVADALRQLGGAGGQAVMVGDRRHDIEGGRANGCTVVAVGWGFAEPGELDAAGPDHVVTTPDELRSVLRVG